MFTFTNGVAFYCVQRSLTFKIYKDTLLLSSIPSFIKPAADGYGYYVFTPPAPRANYYGEYKIEITATLPHG